MMNQKTELEWMEEIRKDPESFFLIEHPTEHLQYEVIKQKPEWIDRMPNCSELLALHALKQDASVYPKLPIKTPSIDWYALMEEPKLLKHIENPSQEMIMYALQTRPKLIHEIEQPSEEMILAVFNSGSAHILGDQFKQTVSSESISRYIIHNFPYYLSVLKNPSESLCLEAIEKNTSFLDEVPVQTKEMIQFALSKDVEAFRYVWDKSIKDCEWYLRQPDAKLFAISYKGYHSIKDDYWIQALLSNGVDALDGPADRPEEVKLWLLQSFESSPNILIHHYFRRNLPDSLKRHPFLKSTYALLQKPKEEAGDEELDDLTISEIKQRIFQSPGLIAKLPLEHRSFQLCRQMMALDPRTKLLSPYHALILLKEAKLKLEILLEDVILRNDDLPF